MNRNANWTRRGKRLQRAMMTGLTMLWIVAGTSCSTVTIKEIPTDRMVVTVHAGQPFTPPCDGKFVPQARWNEMLDAYIIHSQEKK